MHILMTDVLVCPRCGPAFGLILLADRIEDRRVPAGRLGCSNCREQYPIADGVADLTGGLGAAVGPVTADPPAAADDARADRIAALLGVTQPGAFVLLAGYAAADAAAVAARLQDAEVLAVCDGVGAGVEDIGAMASVSRVQAHALPVATAKMAGVAVTGPRAAALLEEAARTVRPTGRLYLDPAPPDAAQRLARLGLRVLAEQEQALLAVRG
jgi:uncharacterized protein YbaR (Trm112 family)